MSTLTLPKSIRQRIAQIERDHSGVNVSTINHYWQHEGLTYEDACEAENLERELDRLDALAASVGLSEEDRDLRNRAEAELDRFVRTAKCHAKKQKAHKQRGLVTVEVPMNW